MALPARSSPRVGRAANLARYNEKEEPRATPSGRSLRTQRPLTGQDSIDRYGRDREPPQASLRASSTTGRGVDPDGSSRSSQASSYIRTGEGSSRTSVEDDYDQNKAQGSTSGIWSRVASAAGSLTVNVGKAWAANLTLDSGEVTPPGHESRISKALRAYHLGKARDPSELPSWLFDDAERRAPSRMQPTSRFESSFQEDREVNTAPPRKGLRDIYDSTAAAVNPPAGRAARTFGGGGGGRFRDIEEPAPSRATDRLRALRDAKRGVPSRQSEATYEQPQDHDDGGYDRMAPPRQGLPMGRRARMA